MEQWYKNPSILKYIRGLKNSGYSWLEIFNASNLNFSDYNFKNHENMRKRYGENKFQLDTKVTVNNNLGYLSYTEAINRLNEYIKRPSIAYQPKKKKSKNKKILIMGDFHSPFVNNQAVANIVKEHKDSDLLVIPGDFLDCYSVSRFSKKLDIPLKEEITQGVALLDWLASIFPEIIILEGNHTDRVRKYFESRVDKSLMFLVQYDLLELITRKYKNVNVVNDHYEFPDGNGEAEIGYFTVIGKDCIVGHFERTSIIPGKAPNLSYQWINSWSNWFGIKDISLLLQAHTHRLSKLPIGDGKVVVGETGCVCQIQGYSIDAKASYTAHLNGFWIVNQNNGITDLNRSNFYIC